jgi:hypothetical protein
MHSVPDRFWWLVAFGGIILAVEMLAALVWSVLGLLINAPFFSGDNGVFLLFALILLIVPFICILNGFRARARFRRRLQALGGEQEALARAAISVDPAAAPDLTNEPLELSWRDTGAWLDKTLMEGSLVVFFCLSMPGVESGIYAVTKKGGFVAPSSLTWFPAEAALYLCWLSGGILIAFYLLALLFEGVLYFSGKSYRLIARPDGLLSIPRLGKSRLLRWEELRLWEVTRQETTLRYRLYGAKTSLEWSGPPALPPVWPSLNKKLTWRHQALLNLLASQTALVPRTLQKELMQQEPQPRAAAA